MCEKVNIGERRKELFKKVKCKPDFGCWMMGCSYEENPEKCSQRIWECEKCGSENLKTPPRTGSGGFDAGYSIYDCKDCGHETIRDW